METILNYIDTMFAGVPATADTRRLREEITANMTDKFDELIKEGKSNNEAVGTVISGFGNIDEVLAEMGIERVGAKEKKLSSPIRAFIKKNIVTAVLRAIAPVALMIALYRIIQDAYWDFRFGIGWTTRCLFIISFFSYSGYLLLIQRKKQKTPEALSDKDREMLTVHRAKIRKISDIVSIAAAGLALAEIILMTLGIEQAWTIGGSWFLLAVVSLYFGSAVFMRTYRKLLGIYTGAVPEPVSAVKRVGQFDVCWLFLIVLKHMRHIFLYDGGGNFEYYLFRLVPYTLILCLAALFAAFLIDNLLPVLLRKSKL